ncbi:g8046 [Coccomyxa elongata]
MRSTALGRLLTCSPVRALRSYERYRPLTSSAAHNFKQVEPYPVPTTRVLGQLKSVLNARDLAEACKSIAPGRVLRAACPISANEEDVLLLREMLQITRLIDLRSDYERRQDGLGLLVKNAHVIKVGRRKGAATLQGDVGSVYLPKAPRHNDVLTVHYISLLERSRYYSAFIRSLPLGKAAAIIFWALLLNKNRAISIAMQEVNAGGLQGLYKNILATSGHEICTALELLREASEGGDTTLFFCKIGKDRTGLLAALVLHCCGASVDEIVSDYMRSDNVGAVALGGMEKEELKGLDVSIFSRSPPEVMLDTIDHVRETYGGLDGYLTSIGFRPEKQRRLAKALAHDGRQT